MTIANEEVAMLLRLADIHTITRDDISALVDTIANFAKATVSGSG